MANTENWLGNAMQFGLLATFLPDQNNSLLAKKWATIGSLSLQLKSERRL